MYLVEMMDTHELFAMKILQKKTVFQKKHTKHVLREKTILMNNTCPFLVQLNYSFQDKNKLYLVMEYIQGGNLF